jgi:RecA/RadA recombinase
MPRKPAVEEQQARTRRTRAPAQVAEKPATRSRSKLAESVETPRTARRSRTTELTVTKTVADEKPATRTTRSRKTDVASSSTYQTFNPYLNLDAILDDIEKHVGLSESTLDKNEGRLSTGCLVLDIILGGGITAGWYTNFGQEQSCKTTGAMTILVSALMSQVPILVYMDYEGSAEPNYIENIMRCLGVDADVKTIFGVRDEKTGKYIIPPRVRYKSEAVAEKFFDYLAKLERMLPDKKKIGDNWYYIYDSKTTDGKIHKANAAIVGKNYDLSYFKKTGKYRIPAPDGSLQAVILLDSYPAMLPEVQDVDDPNSAIAVQARMFSDQLKRVKGRMKSKRIAVIGINQLRKVPMAMYGPSEQEPCGEALKLYSDVRLKFTSRALSAVADAKGKGQIEEEPSILRKGAVDTYRYIHVRGHKNKLSRPYLEGFLRLWISDAKNRAFGFDPVYDTWAYLKATGQVRGKREKMLLQLVGNLSDTPIGWMAFKRLILGDRATKKLVCTEAGMKAVDVRAFCFKQMSSGKAIELLNEHEISERNAKTDKTAKRDAKALASLDGDDEDDDSADDND